MGPIGWAPDSVMSTSYPQRMQIGSHLARTSLRQFLYAWLSLPPLVVVTVSHLRVCAGRPRVGSPCPWPVGPGVGVHLVKLDSMGRVGLWCLLCCLSSLYSSNRVCKYRAVLRSVCRICLALSLPSLCRADRAHTLRARSPLRGGLV